MAQHDYVIDNSTGANVRADINNVLQAIATNNSGSSDPSTTLASQFFADTNAGKMKLRNTANNGYVTLFTLAGGIDVASASNFSADVAFDGTGDQNITFNKSASAFIFNDNAKAQFGTDSDLKVYHTGSHGYVQNENGNLYLTAKSNEDGIIIRPDLQTELYFDNSLKFQTMSSGAELLGHLHMADNNQIRLGNVGSNGDFRIYHDATNNVIEGVNQKTIIKNTANNIHLQAVDGEGGIDVLPNSLVKLYFDNSAKLSTSSTGVSITGNINPSGHVALVDNGEVRLGNSDDMKIFHESSSNDNIIDCATTRPLRIRFGGANQFEFFSSGGFKMNDGRKIVLGDSTDFTLFHNGAVGNIIDCRNGKEFFLVNDSDGGNETMISANPNSVVRLFSDGAQKMLTNSFGIQILNDQKILFKKESSTSGSVICIDFDKDNPTNNVGDISMTNSAVSYNTGSDYRLKENERPIDDAIEKVKLLKPYYFNFIETPETLSQGFYAHEVSNIVPTAVKGEKDQVALNGMPIYQKLDHSKIVPMLAAGLKALIEKVEKLEAA